MKLLFTGGTGFFGKALLRHWHGLHGTGQDAPSITLLSRSPQDFLARNPEFAHQPWLRLHRGDILDPASLPPAGGFTHLLHAAADSTLGPQMSPMQRYAQIVDGTRNLLDYAAQHRIGRFLLTSSGGVYGPQPPGMEAIPESYNGIPDPLRPEHVYGIAKRCAEHLCALYQHKYGIETVVARCFAFIGQDLPLNVHFAIGNFIRDALTAPEITVSGNGTPVRSYMDQRDLAYWLEALLRNGQAGHAYNVGSEEAITIRELAELVRDLLAPGKPVHIAAVAGADSARQRYVPCTTKARDTMGLHLRYTLEQAIEHTVKPC